MNANKLPLKTIGSILVATLVIMGGLYLGLARQQKTASALLTPSPTPPWPTVAVTSTPTPPFTATPTPTPEDTPAPTATPTPTPTPTPRIQLVDIRNLGRLETVDYVMQTVIDIEDEPESTWQRIRGIFGTDKILLIASGDVVAGVDLEKITADDVEISPYGIHLQLPPAELFHVRIDNEDTHVYQRETGILYPFDKDLESAARLKAEQELEKWALEHGILEKAQRNAVAELQRLLHALGFTNITITTRTQN